MTKVYLRTDGSWTTSPTEAADFPDFQAAVDVQAFYGLKQVELVLQIEAEPNPQLDVVFPLAELHQGATKRISKRKLIRVLLRQGNSKLYLQRCGGWSGNRNTAREFGTSVFAYWWAMEQQLLGTEVVLALPNAQHDIVTMRLLATFGKPEA